MLDASFEYPPHNNSFASWGQTLLPMTHQSFRHNSTPKGVKVHTNKVAHCLLTQASMSYWCILSCVSVITHQNKTIHQYSCWHLCQSSGELNFYWCILCAVRVWFIGVYFAWPGFGSLVYTLCGPDSIYWWKLGVTPRHLWHQRDSEIGWQHSSSSRMIRQIHTHRVNFFVCFEFCMFQCQKV